MEIEPEKQNTKIDFYYCRRDLGIPIVCVTEIIKKGKQLFYKNEKGEEIRVKRIYNRVIFDELDLRTDLKLNFHFSDNLEVEWAGHPNWFFRISKFILPFLKGKYFIETTLLSDLTKIPEDLENYVLKPLFSFSGSGSHFSRQKRRHRSRGRKRTLHSPEKSKLHPHRTISRRKSEMRSARAVRLEKEDAAPTLLCNLARLSRGEMIGVKFNKDKDWVGGTLALFER